MTQNELTEVEIENDVEEGDEIAWTEDWTGGRREYRAVVVGTRTKHLGSALAGNDRDVTSFELELIEGDWDDYMADTPQMNVEELAEADNLEIISSGEVEGQ